jgi:hypothetical protein
MSSGCCEPCAEQPAGTVFFCEDGVFTPVPEPAGPAPWVLARSPNVNNNLPYWASWSVLAAADTPDPAPEPEPPEGEPPPWETVK